MFDNAQFSGFRWQVSKYNFKRLEIYIQLYFMKLISFVLV